MTVTVADAQHTRCATCADGHRARGYNKNSKEAPIILLTPGTEGG
jgi:AhpD family alkylhydroperoxidase